MSDSENRASGEVQDERPGVSVFDFLYCDNAKIASFLSQFDPSGHLLEISQSESVVRGTQRGFKVALGGGAQVVGTGGSGNVAFERGPASEGAEGAQRKYDPLWANALNFLDELHSRKYFRTLREASIGQFVIAEGTLSVVDISLMKAILDRPVLKRKLLEGEQTQSVPLSRNQRRTMPAQPASDNEIGAELLPLFPLTAQATLVTEEGVIWSSLLAKALVVQSADILLQHGVNIPGKWAIIGILDAKPQDPAQVAPLDVSNLLPLAAGLAQMIPAMRQVLGRPSDAYGITPLAIVREVT